MILEMSTSRPRPARSRSATCLTHPRALRQTLRAILEGIRLHVLLSLHLESSAVHNASFGELRASRHRPFSSRHRLLDACQTARQAPRMSHLQPPRRAERHRNQLRLPLDVALRTRGNLRLRMHYPPQWHNQRRRKKEETGKRKKRIAALATSRAVQLPTLSLEVEE